jgi:LysM repeat protein
MNVRGTVPLLGVLGAVVAISTDARAFTHIVKPGETLALIAEHIYGDAKLETVLVGANALDTQGGTVIVAGMRLEVPAPGHHTVLQGESWADLALVWLGAGDPPRTELLAVANKGVPWIPPVEGQEIEAPAVVTYIAGEGETINSITQKFWGDPNRGWELNRYNQREAITVHRGEVVLVPVPGLKLTESGRTEARAAAERDGASGGILHDQQRKVDAEIPQLLSDVRYGRYAEAIARGNRMLGTGALTHPQLAVVQRSLLEAYVAIDARSQAATACAAWKSNEPTPILDPIRVSPKIRAACAAK